MRRSAPVMQKRADQEGGNCRLEMQKPARAGLS